MSCFICWMEVDRCVLPSGPIDEARIDEQVTPDPNANEASEVEDPRAEVEEPRAEVEEEEKKAATG